MARIVVGLSYHVKQRLLKKMQRTRDGRLKVRYQIVLLWAEGRSSGQIAQALHCAPSTALNWGHRYLAEGEAGLVDRRGENGQPKVDLDLLQAVAEMIQDPPTKSGWQRSTWTRELMALELEKRTGIRLGVTTIGRMLHRLGARWGTPRPVVRCPWSRRAKARRIRQLKRLIDEVPRKQVVVYQDEVEIHLNPKIGRDWMLPRQQKEAVTPGQNEKRHVAGTLDARTGKLVWVWGDHRNSALFIDQLRTLAKAYPRARKIHVILDNCKAHDSQATEVALKTAELKHIELHFLPPYCPTHNRIERLWKELHANVTRNHTCSTMHELQNRVNHFLTTASPWPGSHPSTAEGPRHQEAA
jgi:transposase